ncbi:single-stranded-DNA-specific exonuclease RecJ [Facklamia sp. DSM 111018]|uniref:Single-stranded-DNA-specific exonuclease RecJ n=1 Tax=Facklamia lactis TaxID=2749967 RepID=A0ABS0LP00_9LACT|nr:single-stranded-DNA-specific exonuclease RecJ [Facklamia lactis]MBG9985895.1 single-stranded-DNA-specific exonuclease RecJ [Facklamia lactis]
MNSFKYQWIAQNNEYDNDFKTKIQKAGLKFSPAFLRLCWNRGLTSPELIEEAINQQPTIFHDPFALYQMDLTIERIQKAVSQEENILIYGDYDADGITSTLILQEAIEAIGGKVQVYLPNRFIDGYGPNIKRYQEFVDAGIHLIITVDNGVAGHQAIDYAMQSGVDVIVTDHHEIQESLPNAFSIIHPRHPKGNYPFGELSGAGVALKVATALLEEIPTEAIELAAIGTVADMVSLTDENRTIVLSGLTLMKETQRVGLQLLLKDSLEKNDKINVETIGFIIGPRLNAVGRLGDPTPALEFLSTFEDMRAQELLVYLNHQNTKRQELVKEITHSIIHKVESLEEVPLVIIAGEAEWHPGVLGIVASRLTEKYQCPVLLFHYDDERKIYKGSGRSIEHINLFNWLSEHREWLMNFGGHSQAAGLTVEEKNWDSFLKAMADDAEAKRDVILQPIPLQIDLEMQADEVSIQLIEEINLLGPFGIDNPKPIVAFYDVLIKEKRLMGNDKQHVKMEIKTFEEDKNLTGIAFSMAKVLNEVKVGSRISLVGDLSINEWRNKQNAQLIVKDFGSNGPLWVDCRASVVPPDLYQLPSSLFVFDSKKYCDLFADKIHNSSKVITYFDQLESELDGLANLVIMEPPQDLTQLKIIYQKVEWKKIYLGSYVSESKYLSGTPTRKNFADLYRFLQINKEFKLEQLGQVAKELQIPLVKIKTMIVVFFEANFVNIENGLVTMQEHRQEKIDLLSLPAMQKYQSAMKAEALLNYETIDVIQQWIDEEII